jgi:hypothetical protein
MVLQGIPVSDPEASRAHRVRRDVQWVRAGQGRVEVVVREGERQVVPTRVRTAGGVVDEGLEGLQDKRFARSASQPGRLGTRVGAGRRWVRMTQAGIAEQMTLPLVTDTVRCRGGRRVGG